MNNEVELFINGEISVGKAAFLIALSSNRNEEEKIKNSLRKNGFKCAATEIGGEVNNTFFNKFVKSLIGSSINNNIIKNKNNSKQIHALIHAAEEAQEGILLKKPGAVNVGMKIGIVRKEGWIAVALFGGSALHNLTNHNRAGLGIMHI